MVCSLLHVFLASTHFLTLLISTFHNLTSSFGAIRLPPDSLSGASHFAVHCWEPVSYRGEPIGLKTQARVGVVAAERDGYNNPCRGSAHVLNYCHKCSSTRPRQDHQSRALSFSRFIIAP